MTVQSLRIGKQKYYLIAKRDLDRLAEQARRQMEDDYWIRMALKAEADARAKGEKPIPLEEVERELDQIKERSRGRRRR